MMLSVTLAEAERQRRALRRQVELQRLAAARIEGELSAARRIQMGILPKPADVLAGEKRFGLSIVLEPAREVGGDLYDFFKLDADRLFFMLGDVTGKGLAGSLFMVGEQVALQEHRAAPGRLRGQDDARGERRDLPRQQRGPVRHRIRGGAGRQDRRARVLQRRPRSPVRAGRAAAVR